MNKIVLINWNEDIKKTKTIIDSINFVSYLFQDLSIYNSFSNEHLESINKSDFSQSNSHLICQDIPQLKKDTFPTINNNILFKNKTEGMIISSRDHYYNSDTKSKYTPHSIITSVIQQNKKVFYTLSENGIHYLKNESGKRILEKLNNDLLPLSNSYLENLVVIYKPSFLDNNVTISNQHIDEIIKVIRSFMNSAFNFQCPVLVSVPITPENILSFCVTNNIDGFMIEQGNLTEDQIIDIVRKVHGWQRIIKNQLMRRRKSY